jgi:hypothetical protein
MRKNTRKKAIVVTGEFESRTKTHRQTWQGKARSMAVGLRQAILDLWKLRGVKGKHYYRVSFTGQPDTGGSQHGHS